MSMQVAIGGNKRLLWLASILCIAALWRLSEFLPSKDKGFETVQANGPGTVDRATEVPIAMTAASMGDVFRQGLLGEVGKDIFAIPSVGVGRGGESGGGVRKEPKRPIAVIKPKPPVQPMAPTTPVNVSAPVQPASLAFPFTVLGRFDMDGGSWLLLSSGSQVRSVKIGQNVDGSWKLEQLTAQQATVLHMASGEKRVLVITSGK